MLVRFFMYGCTGLGLSVCLVGFAWLVGRLVRVFGLVNGLTMRGKEHLIAFWGSNIPNNFWTMLFHKQMCVFYLAMIIAWPVVLPVNIITSIIFVINYKKYLN